jgi:hypothetical protein
LATFTCQPREAVIGRRQENQWLGEFQRGIGPLQNPLFLANVTIPLVAMPTFICRRGRCHVAVRRSRPVDIQVPLLRGQGCAPGSVSGQPRHPRASTRSVAAYRAATRIGISFSSTA